MRVSGDERIELEKAETVLYKMYHEIHYSNLLSIKTYA